MKIIICDCDQATMEPEKKVLAAAGIPYVHKACKTEDDLIKECEGYEIALNQYAPFTEKVLSTLAPTLKQIVRYGVGVNNVDLEAATKYGVQVCNVPDYGMNEVADHAVGMMMSLVRKVTDLSNHTKSTTWDYSKSIPLFRIPGSTVGVIGLGRIGRTFAKRMSGFDVKLIGCDPHYKEGDVVEGVTCVPFEEVVKNSDVISIHCPYTKENHDLFNLEVMKKMKKTAYLINVSRGGLINEDDLVTALKEKIIAGAGIDVVFEEPMAVGNPLFQFDNLLCTPHMAWYSEEAAEELKRKVAEEGVRFSKGEKILYPVNQL